MANLLTAIANKLGWSSSTNKEVISIPTETTYGIAESVKIFGDSVEWLNMDTALNVAKALNECPPISYILYKKALAFGNGQLSITDANGQPIEPKKYKYYKLIKQPNFMQSELQFRLCIKIMIEAYGNCPVLLIRGPFGDILSMWILPPKYVTYKRSGKIFYQRKYTDLFDEIAFNGKPLPKENIFIFTDITPYYNDLYLPMPRLHSCSRVITNISENYKARASLMKNRGAIGVLSNNTQDAAGHVDLTDKEQERLQDEFRRKFNLTESDWNIILSTKNLTWTPMTYPIKDLMMTEQEEHDIMTLTDALGYPHTLLSRGASTAYNNQITAERTLYQNSIIPESYNYDQQLNDLLESEKSQQFISYTYDHLSVLQQDMLLKARVDSIQASTVKTRWMLNAITYNQMLMELGLEPLSKGGEYYYRESPEYLNTIKTTANA